MSAVQQRVVGGAVRWGRVRGKVNTDFSGINGARTRQQWHGRLRGEVGPQKSGRLRYTSTTGSVLGLKILQGGTTLQGVASNPVDTGGATKV